MKIMQLLVLEVISGVSQEILKLLSVQSDIFNTIISENYPINCVGSDVSRQRARNFLNCSLLKVTFSTLLLVKILKLMVLEVMSRVSEEIFKL